MCSEVEHCFSEIKDGSRLEVKEESGAAPFFVPSTQNQQFANETHEIIWVRLSKPCQIII